MALTAYLKVEGEKSGEIKGSCEQGGDKKDATIIYSVDFNVSIPRDSLTGQPTGQRVYSPYCVVVPFDKGQPKYFQLLTTGEKVKKATIDHYRIKKDGGEEKYYTTTLEDALVVSIDHIKHNVQDKDTKEFEDYSKICFTFGKITNTFHDGNVETSDEWKKS
jgi:type VI secretion system secreted protein Hcp